MNICCWWFRYVLFCVEFQFPLSNFTIMLFHYDGLADQWNDLPWYNQSIHIVALQQTKWWETKYLDLMNLHVPDVPGSFPSLLICLWTVHPVVSVVHLQNLPGFGSQLVDLCVPVLCFLFFSSWYMYFVLVVAKLSMGLKDFFMCLWRISSWMNNWYKSMVY